MSENASIVQEGIDRVSDAYQTLDRRVQRLQKELRSRRKRVEKQLNASRRTVERRTRKQLNEIRRNPVLKRARALRDDAGRQIESRLDEFLGFFQIASKADVTRIDRKLNQINRKLREIEKVRSRRRRANGAAATA